MFKNLRTSTKLTLLCAMFIISIGATTYSLVAEKQIAIAFARKELIGSKFLESLRSIYATVLTGRPFNPLAPEPDASAHKMLEALTTAPYPAPALRTGELVQALSGALSRLGSSSPVGDSANAMDLLAKMQQLASRIGDDSNLTLDTDLDSYYLQNILVDQLPNLLGRLGELRMVTSEAAGAATPSNENKAHVLVLNGLIGSATGEIKNNLTAAYRGNADESLKQAVDSTYAALFSSTEAYLAGLKVSSVDGGATETNNAALGHDYEAVVNSAIRAWAVSQSQLDRLLQIRIDNLLTKMGLSLAMTGVLLGLSIIIAIMTYQHIVRPLERLAKVASTVRETKNYDVRIEDNSTNEIGRLASAFNEMLAELASARDRERLEQAELARVARLTTMGVMTASIAHEIKQPLSAIVTNGNAAQRWLSRATPDVVEVRRILKNMIDAGHRANQVIDSVRAMFKQDGHNKDWIEVNELLQNILTLARSDIQKRGILVQTELFRDIPRVLAGRTQLQQVFMNLIMNAVEAMGSVTSRERLLVIRSAIHDPASVLITVKDSGTGIDPENLDRIFDAFFTTKSDGMGMGLSISRSIIEGYGGRLWASRGEPYGSVFHVILPSDES
jgi:signal transduction histidine kinase